MESKNTYNPEDIESLLMNKTYEELLPEEMNFVMQHLESKDEYKLMRTTLLAIKKSADNDESIAPSPKVKEELLLLMESKRNRGFGWINLNGFWSFLFPADVSLFKKPAFQFASLSLVLFFGFYFSFKMMDFKTDNLAINKTVSHEREEVEVNAIEQEKIVTTEVEENKEPAPLEELDNSIAQNVPGVKSDVQPVEIMALEDAEVADDIVMEDFDENIESKDVAMTVDKEAIFEQKNRALSQKTFEKADSDNGYFYDAETEADPDEALSEEVEEIVVVEEAPVPTSLNASEMELSEVVAKKSKSRKAAAPKYKNNIESQSLADDAEIIDLLHVTM